MPIDQQQSFPLHKMAEKEGRVTTAASTVKSLVSEQYLDGLAYDEDEDECEAAVALPPGPWQSQFDEDAPGWDRQGKRHHSSVDTGGSVGEPAEKKKFSMSLGAKGGGGGGRTESPPPMGPQNRLTAAATGPLLGSLGSSKKPALSFGELSSAKSKPGPIKMNLASQSKPKAKEVAAPAMSLKKKSFAMADAFGDDSDESEEEMPAEARMRMRNIGRETPTAAGPNSFGKGNLGFCNRQKIMERELQKGSGDSE